VLGTNRLAFREDLDSYMESWIISQDSVPLTAHNLRHFAAHISNLNTEFNETYWEYWQYGTTKQPLHPKDLIQIKIQIYGSRTGIFTFSLWRRCSTECSV